MKKIKNVVLTALVVCTTVLVSGMKAEPSSAIKVESLANKNIVFEFYNSSYQMTIAYNPSSRRVSSVYFDAETGKTAEDFDNSTAVITYSAQNSKIVITSFDVYISGMGWTTIYGDFDRL